MDMKWVAYIPHPKRGTIQGFTPHAPFAVDQERFEALKTALGKEIVNITPRPITVAVRGIYLAS